MQEYLEIIFSSTLLEVDQTEPVGMYR